MSFKINSNNPAYIKILELNEKFSELDEKLIETKIDDISRIILNDHSTNTIDKRKVLVSLVKNEKARDKLYEKILSSDFPEGDLALGQALKT